MRDGRVNLVVVRTRQLAALRRFDEAIGLLFAVERHGAGPEHLSVTLPGGTVLELYPASADQEVEAGAVSDVRLGVVVRDLPVAVEAAVHAGGAVIHPSSVSASTVLVVLSDPEGRRVELAVENDDLLPTNPPMAEALVLRPIAWVESSLTDAASAPRQGDEGAPAGWLRFEPAVEEALRDLRPW
jgi:hypothetical protein